LVALTALVSRLRFFFPALDDRRVQVDRRDFLVGAAPPLQGIETVNMIRKGRMRWLAKADAVGQALFIGALFGLAI
jgi:hypothetical protein